MPQLSVGGFRLFCLLACLVVIQVAPPSRNSLGAMAPSSLAQNLQLVVAGLGGTPPGNEAALVTSVRARLNGKYNKGDSLSVQVRIFIYGMEPVVSYLRAGIGAAHLRAMSRTDAADHVYKLFEQIAYRTKLIKRFAEVLEDEDDWHAIVAGIALMVQGQTATRPTVSDEADPVTKSWQPAATFSAPWWTSRRWTSVWIWLVAMAVVQLRRLHEAGRTRFWYLLAAFIIVFCGLLYWQLGPDRMPRAVL